MSKPPAMPTLIAEFLKISDQQLKYHPPSSEAIAAAEKALNVKFPSSYLQFLSATAGRTLMLWDLLRVYRDGDPSLDTAIEIVSSNTFNNSGGLPRSLVAFCACGNGDFDCFDTTRPRRGDEYSIVCWRHDAEPDEPPGRLCDSFPEWLVEQIKDRRP